MKKYNILITGGAGYIGSMLSTKLIFAGHKVTVIDKVKYITPVPGGIGPLTVCMLMKNLIN